MKRDPQKHVGIIASHRVLARVMDPHETSDLPPVDWATIGDQEEAAYVDKEEFGLFLAGYVRAKLDQDGLYLGALRKIVLNFEGVIAAAEALPAGHPSIESAKEAFSKSARTIH